MAGRCNIYWLPWARRQLSLPSTRWLEVRLLSPRCCGLTRRQHDCGKLQKLAVLLQRLNQQCHRAVIFSSMTRTLDVIEAFLLRRMDRFLRIDGSTPLDVRGKVGLQQEGKEGGLELGL